MKKLNPKFFHLLFILLPSFFLGQKEDSIALKKIYSFYLTKSDAYSNLEFLTTKIGGRLSGSPQSQMAVSWAVKAMYNAGADTVLYQPCMVPYWVRGKKEKCVLTSAKLKVDKPLKCCALGSSVGTGDAGVKAKVIEVKSFEELEKLGEKEIKGKIVFYNVFFDQSHVKPGTAYSETVKYRGKGASYAAKYGAVASLVRSMTSVADDEPHTGNMNYDSTISKKKITTLALSYLAADELSESLKQDKDLMLYIETHSVSYEKVLSYNIVGQINGSEKPNEYLIAGGHLDSWDNGQGAHDDGAGVVQTIEMLAMFKKLGIKPRHTIRAVAFMNEENGLAGGNAYAKWVEEKKEKHIGALETDAGGYSPRAFGVDTTNGMYNLVSKWANLFKPYLIEKIEKGGGGADISGLAKMGIPCMGFEPDNQRYFDIHHTAQDTFDKVNKRELNLGAASIGALFYLIDRYY